MASTHAAGATGSNGMSSAGEGLSRPLPERVRNSVIELAAQVLGSMPTTAVPPPLRGIARFDPRKRAKLGGAPIAAPAMSGRVLQVPSNSYHSPVGRLMRW